jgi:hypothetical protein
MTDFQEIATRIEQLGYELLDAIRELEATGFSCQHGTAADIDRAVEDAVDTAEFSAGYSEAERDLSQSIVWGDIPQQFDSFGLASKEYKRGYESGFCDSEILYRRSQGLFT